ncbi:MAG: putative 4-alpha-D-((1-_4)-alpha-D-glucano)trehalose trehalohydrolase [Phycisphaerales bacterium]|nr:putative 4-alpha-D-((1->4)-alpha-D-glucano)trehalose trehalohydrolase [Phycisphaerales bacterium]
MSSSVHIEPRTEVEAVPALGASITPEGVTFRVWSTVGADVNVVLSPLTGCEEKRPLLARGNGLFEASFADVQIGDRYMFEVDQTRLPDPYARWLPDGPDGAAIVWRSDYRFVHRAPSLRADELVIYEMHVGTFTPQGTFAAAIPKLRHLKDLGVTCIELMPLAAAAGARGWGYDGVAWFAPYSPYGTPEDLQRFIDEAHGQGLVVIIDMVFNHFGPAGNYLSGYSPEYFTAEHKTPWGDALNYANPYMRRLGLDAAEHWLRTFRINGFRLDATHEIHDPSDLHFLEELAAHVHRLRKDLGTPHFLFCEDDRNWPGLMTRFKMDGVWADDFHHQTRALLTGERDGYFAAYEPTVTALANCINRGWTYEGQTWKVGKERQRGNPADDLPASSFVYTIQNHDQIGNRAIGDRLHLTAGTDGFLAASTLLLFLPMTPLIFQGQEWMADTPFQYFTDHAGELGQAITRGRTAEFAHFQSFAAGDGQVPDPQAEQTFLNSKLDWSELLHGEHPRVLGLYRELLRLRRTDPVLAHSSRRDMRAWTSGDVLIVERSAGSDKRTLLINFGAEPIAIDSVDSLLLPTARVLVSTSIHSGTILPSKVAAIFAHG